jgi:multidrug transporter EmrE-like cation transporter
MQKQIGDVISQVLPLLPVLVFSYAGQILLRRGASAHGPVFLMELIREPLILFRLLFNPVILLGLGLSGIGAIFYLSALSRLELSIALPLLGAVGFLFLPLIGYIFLGEQSGLSRILGIAMISAGMVIVARS